MATKTVLNTSSMPPSTQRGISIIIDQDQAQKPKPQDIQLDMKRQKKTQQPTSSPQPELNTNNNNNKSIELNEVEISIQHEMSPKFSTQTKTFIDINRNDVQINGHYELGNSQNITNEVKETGYTTLSTFLHIDQKESTQAFGERGKLVDEKTQIVKARKDNINDDNDDDDVHGILVGKLPIQTQNVVAPIDNVVSVSRIKEESTNRSSNGTTTIDEVQHEAMKPLSVCVKKTIIQCNVENNNDHHNDWNNEESVRICSSDADDDGQLLYNGLRIVDINSQQQSKLHDVLPVLSHISCLTKADCARSAAKQTFEYNADNASHVVKIQIKPNTDTNTTLKTDKQVTVVQVNENPLEKPIKDLKIKNEIIEAEMVQKPPTTTSIASATQNGHNSITSGNTTVTELNVSNPSYLYYTMSSGQFSPCDTLDSGTGSDLESNGTSGTPITTQSPKGIIGMNSGGNGGVITNGNGNAPKLELHLKTTKIRVNNGASVKSSNKQNGEHQRAGSLTDSEESESSSLSCDSLHSAEYIRQSSTSPSAKLSPKSSVPSKMLSSFLPDSLLRDIRDRKFPTNDFDVKYGNQASIETVNDDSVKTVNAQKLAEEVAEHAKFLQECNARDNEQVTNDKRVSMPPCKTFILNSENGTFFDTKMNSMPRKYEADKYYNFHVNEHENFHSFSNSNGNAVSLHEDETSLLEYDTKINSIHDDDFAGYKDIRCSSATSTIRSSKGTVRGVKNRVRNGIATFLQMQQPHVKNFMEKDLGKVVLYTTSMGIIRDTYAKCSNVKQILRTLLVKFEERDVFMSVEYQAEIKNRMHSNVIRVPQLFVEGQHIGDAETVERLNESGELRQLLKPYKSISTTYTCQTCGGYRLLPCPSCNGSKKSVHRNHFTAEFVALKCMNCDEVGLVKCHNC